MKKFIIPKGCHYSNFLPKIFLTSGNASMTQSGEFTFTESCKYEISEESCVNKLFGFCFGFGVHTNSIRFGWTYNSEMNQIFIWKYVYLNKKLHKEKIFACEIGEKHKYTLDIKRVGSNNAYTFNVNFKIDTDIVADTNIVSGMCFITTLGPYFGGNTRAPHKMTILSEY